jgi:ankyrin repeat protein
MNVDAIFSPRGGMSQMLLFTLLGIHSTKYDVFLAWMLSICSSTSFDDILPRKCADTVRYTPRRGSQAAIMFLLSNSCDVNSGTVSARYCCDPRDVSGATHWSIRHHRHALFDYLALRADEFDVAGFHPIHVAAHSNNLTALRRLLCAGANADARALARLHTSLHIAASRCHSSSVRLLVSRAADADARGRDGDTPLSLAVERGCVGIARCLLAAGAHLPRGAALTATHFRHPAALAFLLASTRADPNAATAAGVTPLLGAAASGWWAIAEVLARDPRVDVNVAMADGATPLYFAVKRGMRALFDALIARPEIDLRARTPCGGTLLHAAANSAYAMRALLARRAIDVNAVDAANETALHRAALAGNEEVVESLLAEADVDVNVVAPKGGMPLHFAIAGKSDAVAVKLAECKRVDINWKAANCPMALNLALSRGANAAAIALCRRSDLDLTGQVGVQNCWPPLTMAAMHGMKEAVQLLLEHTNMKADCSAYGLKYARAFALQKGFGECAELLKPNGMVADGPDNNRTKKRAGKSGFWQRLRRRITRTKRL